MMGSEGTFLEDLRPPSRIANVMTAAMMTSEWRIPSSIHAPNKRSILKLDALERFVFVMSVLEVRV